MRNGSIAVGRCLSGAVGVIDGNFLDLEHMARQSCSVKEGIKLGILESLPRGEHRQSGQR